MSTPPERLKQERLKLGLSQEAFGAIGGVRKQAQIKYEKGDRKPDADYLERIAAAGVDVGYVLTGINAELDRRLNALSAATEVAGRVAEGEGVYAVQAAVFDLLVKELDSDERLLIQRYRKADRRGQDAILATAAAMIPDERPVTRKKKGETE